MVVGVFDSGVGGLTVAERLFTELPRLSVHYFGDTAHVPYGGRTAHDVSFLVCRIAGYLYSCGAQALVLACNTSSAIAIDSIRRQCSIPVVGIIDSACRAAVESTPSGRIGVLCNALTAKSRAYPQAALSLARRMGKRSPEMVVVGCPRLVPLIEAGQIQGPEAVNALTEYLEPLKRAEIDTLVLGCTHYPFLAPLIQEMMGPSVHLIDPACFVGRELVQLGLAGGAQSGEHRFEVSGCAYEFERTGSRLLGRRLYGTRSVNLDLPAVAAS